MAVKRSVLEVDVDDKQFKRYSEAFNKYKKDVDKLPVAFGAITKENKASVEAVRMMTAAMMANMSVMRQQAANSNSVAENSRRTASYWQTITGHIRQSSGYLHQQVNSFLRMTGIGGALGGIALGGGVWGLERLASSASAGRRSATGLGVSYGEQAAFGLNFNRVLDAPALLRAISTAKGDLSSGEASAMWSLGLNPAGNGSTASGASSVMQRVREMTQGKSDRELGFLYHGRQLGNLGMGIEDLRRIRDMSEPEFKEHVGRFNQDKKQLDVMDATLKKWQDFDVALDRAGSKLKNAFIDGLEPLMPLLTQLSDGLSSAVNALMKSDGFKFVVEKLALGMKSFADYVGRPDFQDDVKKFGTAIYDIGKWLFDLNKWLMDSFVGRMISDSRRTMTDDEKKMRGNLGLDSGGVKSGREARIESRKEIGKTVWDFITSPFKKTSASTDDANMDKVMTSLAAGEQDGRGYGSLGPWLDQPGGKDRAYGKYQVMGNNIPSWTKEATGTSMSPHEYLGNPTAQEATARYMMKKFMKKYGTTEDAYSVWHSGRPLDQATREGAADVNMSTSQYTRNAQDRLHKLQSGDPRVNITIENKSGSSVGISTSTMGVGGGGGGG